MALQAEILNFDITLSGQRAVFGKILTSTWEEALEGEFLILVLGGLHDRHLVQLGISCQVRFFSRTEEDRGKT